VFWTLEHVFTTNEWDLRNQSSNPIKQVYESNTLVHANLCSAVHHILTSTCEIFRVTTLMHLVWIIKWADIGRILYTVVIMQYVSSTLQ
jgi:hypothetical protein